MKQTEQRFLNKYFKSVETEFEGLKNRVIDLEKEVKKLKKEAKKKEG